MKMLRLLALLEGFSLIILLFIAMPLKYFFAQPEMVRVVGMAHGLLFIAYAVLLMLIGLQEKWSFKVLALSFIAAFIPFGTFYADRKFFRPRLRD